MWAGTNIAPVTLENVEQSVLDGTNQGTVKYRNAFDPTKRVGGTITVSKKGNATSSNTTTTADNNGSDTAGTVTTPLVEKTFFQKYKWPLIGGGVALAVVGVLVVRKMMK